MIQKLELQGVTYTCSYSCTDKVQEVHEQWQSRAVVVTEICPTTEYIVSTNNINSLAKLYYYNKAAINLCSARRAVVLKTGNAL